MEPLQRILAIDKTPSTRQLLEKILADYNLTFTDNADDALQAISETPYSLILASIDQKTNIDGFNIVEQIKAVDNNSSIPVIFLSYVDDKLDYKDINYCEVKKLSEPLADKLLIDKIETLIKQFQEHQEQESEISEVVSAMLSLQDDKAKLASICRFLQRSFFCADIHALCEQLFTVTRTFNINCTLYVHSEKNNFFISDGVSQGEQLNNDILQMVKNEARIFQFGHDRAVFNWDCASLLVNKLGPDVDNLAMLMDGFEMGFKAIESVDEFNQILDKYQKQDFELKLQIARVIEDVATNITDELNMLGTTTMLTEAQEQALVSVAEQGRKDVDTLFSEGMQLEKELSLVMTKMRTQSESISSADTTDNTDDGIEFF